MNKKNDILAGKVTAALKEVIPYIESHGGGVELVSVKSGKATIRIKGVCVGCPMANVTFDESLKSTIKKKVPEIKKVEFITK